MQKKEKQQKRTDPKRMVVYTDYIFTREWHSLISEINMHFLHCYFACLIHFIIIDYAFVTSIMCNIFWLFNQKSQLQLLF